MQFKHEGSMGLRERSETDHDGGDVDTQAQWARVRARLREEFGEAAFRSWLRSMTLLDVVEGRVRIGVPTRFLREWVAAHYTDRIRALWNAENAAISAIEVFVTGGAAGPARGARRDAGEAAVAPVAV